jgi:hypothetical protein
MHPTAKSNTRPIRPACEPLDLRLLLSITLPTASPSDLLASPLSQPAATAGIQGYAPQQIRKAYGFDQVRLSGGKVAADGSGQTIAIVTAYNDPNIASDLRTFDAAFGLAAPRSFSVVNQSGGSASSLRTDAGWAGETSLDVEWAHAIAPGAKLLLVEAKSASFGDLLSAVDYARHAAGVSVVSMSWGGDEFASQRSYDTHFTTPGGHPGVTFVAASGDNGSWWGPEWPSSSPNVLAVGGTTLSLTSSGAPVQTAWSGSGGGWSAVEPTPSYQSGVQNSGSRTAPDVSYDANPYTGFAVYDSVPDGYDPTGWQVVGGTSAGTPQWAGLIAIADQSRALAGKASLDGARGTLPTLYSLYKSSSAYAGAFTDVTSGASSYWDRAARGYDAVTGLGSPKAPGIVAALTGNSAAVTTAVAKAAASSAAASTTSTTTTTTTSHHHHHHHHATVQAQSVTDTSGASAATAASMTPPIASAPSSSGNSAGSARDAGVTGLVIAPPSPSSSAASASTAGTTAGEAASSPSVFSSRRVSPTSAGYEPPSADGETRPTPTPAPSDHRQARQSTLPRRDAAPQASPDPAPSETNPVPPTSALPRDDDDRDALSRPIVYPLPSIPNNADPQPQPGRSTLVTSVFAAGVVIAGHRNARRKKAAATSAAPTRPLEFALLHQRPR